MKYYLFTYAGRIWSEDFPSMKRIIEEAESIEKAYAMFVNKLIERGERDTQVVAISDITGVEDYFS